MDNFDNRMAAIQPGRDGPRRPTSLSEAADEKMSVSLRFNKMDDFSPAAVARQVPAHGQAAGGARAARQPAALHGRQGGGRGSAEEAAERSAADGRAARTRSEPADRTRRREIELKRRTGDHGKRSWSKGDRHSSRRPSRPTSLRLCSSRASSRAPNALRPRSRMRSRRSFRRR